MESYRQRHQGELPDCQRGTLDSARTFIRSVSKPFSAPCLAWTARLIQIKLLLPGPLKGYTLVAHRSGHTLGGSLFTIRPSLSSSLSPASSSSSLLYAPIFNHVKEHHLDGAALLNGARIDDAMRRMGVVVVGADRSLTVNTKRVDRERKLLSERLI